MTHPLGMSSRHSRNGMCHASRRSPMSHARRSTRFLPATVPAVVALGLITSMSPTWAESVPVPSTGTQQAPVAAAPTTDTAGSFYYVPRSSAVHDDDIEVTRTLRRVDNELVPVTVTTVAVNRTVAQTVRFRSVCSRPASQVSNRSSRASATSAARIAGLALESGIDPSGCRAPEVWTS